MRPIVRRPDILAVRDEMMRMHMSTAVECEQRIMNALRR